jgi:hypothetical protein
VRVAYDICYFIVNTINTFADNVNYCPYYYKYILDKPTTPTIIYVLCKMTVYCRTDAELESGIDGDNIEDDCVL